MGGDDPERRAAFQVELDDERAARFESRQRHLVDVVHHAASEQHDIAVPAMGARRIAERNRDEAGLLFEPGQVEQAVTLPKRLSASCRAMTSAPISAMTRAIRSGSKRPSTPTHLWTL